MREPNPTSRYTYRLIVNDTAGQAVEVAEVNSPGPDAALDVVQRLYPGRSVEIVENGRLLARVRNVSDGGCWIVEASGKARPAARPFNMWSFDEITHLVKSA